MNVRETAFLGIDTSAYTTSAALVSSDGIRQVRRLLEVKPGERGLRQGDAVFAHTKALPSLLEELFEGFEGGISAVGITTRPRDVQGSYMPCFLAGVPAAKAFAIANDAQMIEFSHQAGHIMAAIYSSGYAERFENEFLAFHVSGGTSELLHVRVTDNLLMPYEVSIVSTTRDISAGQAIDRVGVALGCPFPSGMHLENLAEKSAGIFKPAVSVDDYGCNLSGIENLTMKMIEEGKPPQDTAKFTLEFVCKTIMEMTRRAVRQYPNLPILFAGGVMCNEMIKNRISGEFNAYFAQPAFSSDNASGIALLAMRAFDVEHFNG